MPYGGHFEVLFAGHPGFRRTRLFRHKALTGVYVTLDVWETKAHWEAFHRAAEEAYRVLDRRLAMLKLDEQLLGFYEGSEEYQAPPDRDD